MLHAPLKRLVPGADTAVVLIHGILSTPRYFDDFAAALPQDVSLHSVLLPGHGGTVRQFGSVRWGDWLRHVADALDEMRKSHRHVYVVGHSLGTLLAMEAVAARPDRADGLLLIAVPLRLCIRPKAFIGNILKGVGLTESKETLQGYYGTDQDWRVWRYLPWIPRYLELFSLCARGRKRVGELRVPVRAFMSPQDELVSMRSCRYLRQAPHVHLTMLTESGHHDFGPADKALMLQSMLDMIRPD